MSEKIIENLILEWLSYQKDCFAWKNNSTGIYDTKKKVFRQSKNKYAINGVSDILGVYKGRMLAIEVKAAKGKVSKAQEDFINRVTNQGGIAFVARDIRDVVSTLKEFDNEHGIKGIPE